MTCSHLISPGGGWGRCGDADACVLFIFDICLLERHLHREVARETVRCRHQALDRILLRPSSSFAGDPEECRRADGGPDEPGIGNVFESADNRAAFSGSFNGHARGA